jgi:sulfur carrier protein ThiS
MAVVEMLLQRIGKRLLSPIPAGPRVGPLQVPAIFAQHTVEAGIACRLAARCSSSLAIRHDLPVGRRALGRAVRYVMNSTAPQNLAIKPKTGSLISPERLAAQTAAWSLRLSHENTFLSWGRNAIISTVAGVALVQYRKNEGRPPLAALGLLLMGCMYMVTGSLTYIFTAVLLRDAMRLNSRDLLWISVQATWPVLVWGLSFMCMLDEEPDWLMDVLRLGRLSLPSVLHDNLFLTDAEIVLEPIVRMTEVVAAHEHARLRSLEYQRWWHALGERLFDLSTSQSPSIDETDDLRDHLDRLDGAVVAINGLLVKAAEAADKSVSADDAVHVLSQLIELLNVVEVAIEGDIARLYDRALWGRIAVTWSRGEKSLADELETVRYLRRRVMSVSVIPRQFRIAHREIGH